MASRDILHVFQGERYLLEFVAGSAGRVRVLKALMPMQLRCQT